MYKVFINDKRHTGAVTDIRSIVIAVMDCIEDTNLYEFDVFENSECARKVTVTCSDWAPYETKVDGGAVIHVELMDKDGCSITPSFSSEVPDGLERAPEIPDAIYMLPSGDTLIHVKCYQLADNSTK